MNSILIFVWKMEPFLTNFSFSQFSFYLFLISFSSCFVAFTLLFARINCPHLLHFDNSSFSSQRPKSKRINFTPPPTVKTLRIFELNLMDWRLKEYFFLIFSYIFFFSLAYSKHKSSLICMYFIVLIRQHFLSYGFFTFHYTNAPCFRANIKIREKSCSRTSRASRPNIMN